MKRVYLTLEGDLQELFLAYQRTMPRAAPETVLAVAVREAATARMHVLEGALKAGVVDFEQRPNVQATARRLRQVLTKKGGQAPPMDPVETG